MCVIVDMATEKKLENHINHSTVQETALTAEGLLQKSRNILRHGPTHTSPLLKHIELSLDFLFQFTQVGQTFCHLLKHSCMTNSLKIYKRLELVLQHTSTPAEASNTATAPSSTRSALSTSRVKSTWPETKPNVP